MNLTLALTAVLAQAAPTAPGSGAGQQWMVWAIIAFGAALALLILEAFVPSGGVLGALAALLAVAGIIMFFQFDDKWGMVSMVVTLLSSPFVVAGLLWLAPKTPIGRAMTLEASQERVNEEGRPADEKAITVGLEGVTLTGLRPVGACRINDQRIDCIAQSGMIGAGVKVKVVLVEGSTVKVKAV